MSDSAVEARTPMAVACGTCVPFGQHKGQTIARVGASDAGLSYLRWAFSLPTTKNLHGDFSRALSVYFAEPSIAKRLDDLPSDFDARKKRW